MTTENTTPNFFTLLGLNPDDPWDETRFEQALRDKRTAWSRQGSSIGVKALQAKKNLELVPAIRRVMADPELRADQATEAKTVLLDRRKTRIDSFERQLALAEAKGYIEEGELEKFIKEFKDALTESEIRSRVKVRVQGSNGQATKEIQQLDPTTIKDINDKLQIINKSDLYDLLALPQTTFRQELSHAAQQLYDDMVRRQPKTAEVTAKTDLAGHAKYIFKSDEMRRKYDESLRQSSLNALLKELDESIGRATEKGLFAKQVTLFLEAAAKAGWSYDTALLTLRAHAKDRKWFLQEPTIEVKDQKQRCEYCHELNEKGRNYCWKCAKELNLSCPGCGRSVPSNEDACGECGFPVGNRFRIDELLAEIRYLVKSQDLKTAEERLIDAERAWPLSKPDKRLQEIRECRDELQRLKETQQRAGEKLLQLINQREFFTARQFLSTQSALLNQQWYQNSIDAGITSAQNTLRRAQIAGINREEKVGLCLQALRICADYQDARDLLKLLPPNPPRDLQAKVVGTVVNLTWELSSSANVEYKIVCKKHSQPLSLKDGQILETITGRVYDDTSPEVGIPLFYAVFAVYEGVVSAQAAVLREPAMLIQGVRNITVRTDNQCIDLSWQVPSNIHHVVVVRKENTQPGAINDGTPISLLDTRHLVDTNVQNSHSYFYGIYCQFKDYNGRIVNSPVVFAQATPESPPEIVKSLQIETTKLPKGQEVVLKWQPPSKGDVAVLKSVQPLTLRAGDSISQSDLSQHGQVLESRLNMVQDMWTHPGIAYYTPVVLFRDTAYIGESARYICTEDISNLRYQNIGTALRLQWDWPENCNEALVIYRTINEQGLNAEMANTHKVTQAEYDFHGHFDIRGTTNQNYTINVAAIVRQGNEQITTPGACIQALLASKIDLSYEFKLPMRFVRKQYLLHLHTPKPGRFPTLLIVLKRNGLPLNKTDGELLCRLPNLESTDIDLFLPLPDKTFPPNTFGKVFLEDDSSYNTVKVNHPSIDKLRLG